MVAATGDRRDSKHPDYDNLIQRVLSTEQLDEVDKCILMCRECHGISHAQNIGAELLVQAKIGTKKSEQRLKGYLIIDRLKGQATFLTNGIRPVNCVLAGWGSALNDNGLKTNSNPQAAVL